MTGTLTLRYHRPTPLFEELVISGRRGVGRRPQDPHRRHDHRRRRGLCLGRRVVHPGAPAAPELTAPAGASTYPLM
ncbi:hypothetical protein [Nocardioides sp. B-3]|uniref:hypothetical protein n=1 Tax=Nocardioides sp. B-3 TaxID=2895565 RepID=UPI002152792D|nr:hypothetical protein [Nocardioides sp. B-3]UUZ59419.1 hypothetical protein LP418_27095 [Nocardioides sp. B-3]